MRSREPLAGAVIGALVLVVANVAFAWFATAPDHYEWTDSAIFMSPFAAAFGAIAGAATGALLRRGTAASDHRHDKRRTKRKYL